MIRWLSRSLRVTVSVVAVGLVTALVPGAAQAAPYCGQVWGSLPESDLRMDVDAIDGVRAGRHACFDRLVVDVHGDVGGYDVRYVTRVAHDGSGTPVPLRGGAFLQVVVRNPVVDQLGHVHWAPTRPTELVDVRGWTTFRQVAYAGCFEGQTTVGVGVRARLPFRVLALDGPGDGSRLVIDVAHRW
jgi:hypothetical protein